MKIAEFGVEIWMNKYELICAHNLAETCVESLTVRQLLDLSGKSNLRLDELLPMKLTYGAIEGSDRLRAAVAALYQNQSPERVLITHGAIGANALLYETLIEPGDEIVSVVPTYQQHYSIPESYGATVKKLPLRPENAYLPDIDELKTLVTPKTKLIAFTNPNNPTGAVMDRALLDQIIDIARANDAYILCDEVYRGINQDNNDLNNAIADLYEKGISVGSMSKAFALAGLRLGWIVAPKDVLHQVMIHRDYNTISVGMLDDHFAALALENASSLLHRNRAIVRTNLAMLSDWVDNEPRISWVKPKGGTVTLLKYDLVMTSEAFCKTLVDETGVMLMPGSALNMEGTVRIGFGNPTDVMKVGLQKLSGFLAKHSE